MRDKSALVPMETASLLTDPQKSFERLLRAREKLSEKHAEVERMIAPGGIDGVLSAFLENVAGTGVNIDNVVTIFEEIRKKVETLEKQREALQCIIDYTSDRIKKFEDDNSSDALSVYKKDLLDVKKCRDAYEKQAKRLEDLIETLEKRIKGGRRWRGWRG